jgi:cytochrome c biogenesis protein
MMSKQETTNGPFSAMWKFFASVRLTIVLLLTLAITSIVGTLIPQNQAPEAYFNAFGAFFYRFFNIFGIFDLYHSWWFQTLMLMLTLNVLVCSIERLSSTWRIIFVRLPTFNLSRFRRLEKKEKFTQDCRAEQLKSFYQSVVSRSFGSLRLENTDSGYAIFGEKGRWTRIGVYIVHLSVILMLIGAVIGSVFGFEGFVNIDEGDTVQHIRLRTNNAVRQLDFAIRCDDFDVSFYENGAPREFRSSLTILEDGKPVLSKDIIVNDPLKYKGISLFQSSYGELPPQKQNIGTPEKFTLVFTSKATGMIYEKKASLGQSIQIPEGIGTFVVNEIRNSFHFRGQDLGTAFIGTLQQADGTPAEVVLPLQFPSFDKMGPIFNKNRKDAVIISVAGVEAKSAPAAVRYYTGLQVVKDPGVWVVYCGFILMIIGCCVTFFMSHRQICVEVVEDGEKCHIAVAATSNKNKLATERKIEKIANHLAAGEREN